MPAAGAMTLLLGAILAHQLLVLAVPVGWLAPNLTLLGLWAAVLRRPEHWAWYALMAAVSVLPWSGPSQGTVIFLYSVIAGMGAALLSQWDIEDARLETAAVAVAAALLTAGMLLAKGAASWALWGWGAVHVGLTVATLFGLRWMWPAPRRA